MDSPHFQPSLVDILLREDPHPPLCPSYDFHLHKMLDTILHLDQILLLWTPCCLLNHNIHMNHHSTILLPCNVIHSDCKIFAVMSLTYSVSFSVLQQNSINLTRMGPHKCQVIEYFRSSNDMYSDVLQTLLETFLNTTLKSACFTDKTFFGGEGGGGEGAKSFTLKLLSSSARLPGFLTYQTRLKEIFCTRSDLNKQ